MVREDGLVKLLDFGLVTIAPDSRDSAATPTAI
jgi:hypothetical protein